MRNHSVVGHSTIWQENVKEKGLDYLHFSCTLDVLPALQFQPVIICISTLLRTQRPGNMGFLHYAALHHEFPWIFEDERTYSL